MRSTLPFSFLTILLLFISTSSWSQDKIRQYDSWTTAGISVPLSKKWTANVNATMFRRDNFYSDYLMTFVDASATYKLNPKWSFKILERTRFIPDQKQQFWFFFDAVYTLKKDSPLYFKNRVRMHYGTEINVSNADFIRDQIEAHYTINEKITTFFTVEPFFQFNKLNELNRIRLETGVNWKIKPSLKCKIGFRHEQFYNSNADVTAEVILLSLNYGFK